MKKSTYLNVCLLLLFVLLLNGKMYSQTMTGTVLAQPCNNNGQIGVTVTGLTPPINYVYSNWDAGVFISHTGINSLTDAANNLSAYQMIYSWLDPNVWYVSATDGINTVNGTYTLTPPFSDTIKYYPGTCPSPSTLQAINFVGGTAPYSVVWTNTITSLTYPSNPAFVPNGTYTFIITDGAGCTVRSAVGNSTLNLYVNSISGIVTNITGSPANCTNGTATVSASGGIAPYTFVWNNSATSNTLSGLTQGALTCIATDNIGCQGTGYYWLTQAVTINFNTSVTNATCLQNNGSILGFISGGTAPYSILWSNGASTPNISGLLGNQAYYAQITDANGCTGTGGAYVSVTTPIAVNYSATASSCTSPTGSATLSASGGLAPYTYFWNTLPSSTSISISGKPSGTYNFTVTDANGCKQTGGAFIPTNSNLSGYISNGTALCPATTGNVQAVVSGSNTPFTYLWSNASTSSGLVNVPIGNYSCVITDAVGCTITKYGGVYQSSPINVGYTSIPSTCIYSNNGSATAFPTGGTAPYTYLWSNSQTSATASNLLPGFYSAYVTDANGCHNTVYGGVSVMNSATSNSCYCTITGTVYADANSNCVRNSFEAGIPNIQIHCSGIGYVYTNANGVYSFQVPGGTYTISESVQSLYPLSSCQANHSVVTVVAAPSCVSTVNFGNNVIAAHDLHIITSNINPPVAGNIYTQKIIVQNEGTLNETSIKLGYKHDGQLNYSTVNPWTFTQQNSISYPNWYSITSGFPGLNLNTNSASYVYYNVPTNIPINTQVVFYDTAASAAPIATNWLNDYTPWNNVNTHNAYVVASYDPNFKEVSPQGTGPQGNISTGDSVLTYVVHFQNLGNYYAQNVVVVDSIDSDLNISTLRPGYSDRKYTVDISETAVVKFNFKNINLPWKSQYGDVLSSGMFVYSIKMKKGLPVGRQITNKAAIYFDYNEPVITNTTLNTISALAPVSITEFKRSLTDKVNLFPNPTRNEFYLLYSSIESGTGELSVFDISGREVSNMPVQINEGENTFSGNTSMLQNGIYLVQLKTNSQTITKKLVVAK